MYDQAFYDLIREGTRRSAERAAPVILLELEMLGLWVSGGPLSVVDVGCGEGWWGKALSAGRPGVRAQGFDGDYVADPVIPFTPLDLSVGPLGLPRAELAVCLEVAEHLDPDRAEGFIDDLCACAPTILFSAAIPGQGGVDHRNERWQSYWAGLFEARGYYVNADVRWGLWNDEQIEPWYRQNLMLLNKAGVVGSGPLDVVHPIYWRDRGHGPWSSSAPATVRA